MNNENLLIFHLESVNNLAFFQHRDLFPNLNSLLEHSTFYKNYYSTATSTYMVITDLFFGNTDEFEDSDYLENVFMRRPETDDFMECAYRDFGFKTKYYVHSDYKPDKNNDLNRIFSKNMGFLRSDNFETILMDFDFFTKQDKWCVMFGDSISHISSFKPMTTLNDFENRKYSNNIYSYLYRYKQIDEDFGALLNIIKKNNKLEKTKIIVYGDHGDDLFNKGLHDGYFHAIEPFPFIINCPLIIYDSKKDFYESDELLATTDLNKIIMNSMRNNLQNIKNNYVFSRNLFSKQKLSKFSFNKSYAVSNKDYTLMVSNGGLRLYFNKIDIPSGRNLLDFYKLEGDKIVFCHIFNSLSSSHFKAFFTKPVLQDIGDNFSKLLPELKKYVQHKSPIGKMKFRKIFYSYDIKKCKKELFFRKIKSFVFCVKRMLHIK